MTGKSTTKRKRSSSTTSKTPGDLLHSAIASNDWPECKRLIDTHGTVAVTAKNQRGSTPLMLAADGKCGRNNKALLDALLTKEAGGAMTAAERNRKGKTAADIANDRGATDLAIKLRAMEGEATSKEIFSRCPHCSAKLRSRPKLAFLADQVSRGEENNPLILEVFDDKSIVKTLCRVEYHRINSCINFRKELTESMSLISTLRKLNQKVSAVRKTETTVNSSTTITATPSNNNNTTITTTSSLSWKGLHIIDLCSGSSMNSALALNLLPDCFVSAVDIVGSDKLPHFDKIDGLADIFTDDNDREASTRRFHYIEDDINNPQLLKKLQHRIDSVSSIINREGDDVAETASSNIVVLAMHCCGNLSLRAIDIFNKLNANTTLIMPCCLPSKVSKIKDKTANNGSSVTLPSSSSATSSLISPPLSTLSGGNECISTTSDHDLAWIYSSSDQDYQYKKWVEFLRQVCEKSSIGTDDADNANGVIATSSEVAAVLSPRCMLISAIRRSKGTTNET